MRRSLLLIFLLFVFVPLSQAQVWEHVPCESRAIEFFLEHKSNTIDLTERIEAASSKDDLIAVTAEYIDSSGSFPFATGYCLEGFDIMWRLARLLNDAYAGQVVRLLGVADEDNPFWGALPADHGNVQQGVAKLETILAAGEREIPETDGLFDGPDCHYEIMIFPVERALAHEPLMAQAESLQDIEDILAFGRALIAWRDTTWSTLPGCWRAFHYLLEADRLSLLIAMQRALAIAGVDNEQDLFAEELDAYLTPKFGRDWSTGFMEERLRAEKRPVPTVFGIRACSLAELESFAHMPAEFDNLLADAKPILSNDERLSFIQRQVQWRRRLWLQMPMCQQVLELAWLMRQISSDYAAIYALQVLADGMPGNPYAAQLGANHANEMRLNELRASFTAYLSGEMSLPDPIEATTFTCGDILALEDYEPISAGFQEVMDAAEAVNSQADAMKFAESYIEWREGYLARLPQCPEALEFGWLEVVWATAKAHLKTLELAGVPSEDNPYILEQEATVIRWRSVHQAIRGGETLPKESGGGDESRLQHCSDADELAIALAALKFEELLKYPRADTIEEIVEYSVNYIEWRDIGFRAYPLCLHAHNIRLQFTQIVGDIIARWALDIDGRLYGSNPWRQLPNDSERFDKLTDALFDSRLAFGPPPAERVVAVCSEAEVDAVSELANGILSLARTGEALELPDGLSSYHQQILDWRDDLVARLPQCAGAVKLGWLMNDISIDLAVLYSLIFVGADADLLPHPTALAEGLARVSQLAKDLGIAIDADLTP